MKEEYKRPWLRYFVVLFIVLFFLCVFGFLDALAYADNQTDFSGSQEEVFLVKHDSGISAAEHTKLWTDYMKEAGHISADWMTVVDVVEVYE